MNCITEFNFCLHCSITLIDIVQFKMAFVKVRTEIVGGNIGISTEIMALHITEFKIFHKHIDRIHCRI